MRHPGLVLLAAGAIAGSASAQANDDCFPGPESNEAKTLAIYAVPLAYSAVSAPDRASGRVRIAVEATYLPNIDDSIATPTICRPGKGPENTDLLAGFIRPRVAVQLGSGFTVEGSWVPPVRVNGVKANLFGFAIEWTRELSASTMLGLRGHTTLGEINAPITCPDEALEDPLSECYQGTRSDDSYKPNMFGFDARIGFSAAGGRLKPYLGGGYNRLMPRFQVNFVNSAGQLDDRKVSVDLNRGVLFGGVAWAAFERVGFTGEIYSAPADATTGRLVVSYR